MIGFEGEGLVGRVQVPGHGRAFQAPVARKGFTTGIDAVTGRWRTCLLPCIIANDRCGDAFGKPCLGKRRAPWFERIRHAIVAAEHCRCRRPWGVTEHPRDFVSEITLPLQHGHPRSAIPENCLARLPSNVEVPMPMFGAPAD